MIYNSYNEALNLRIIDVAPSYQKNETVSNLLDGTWHIQTVGARAERLNIEVVCTFTVLKELQDYADEKERLTVVFLGLTKVGVIAGQPSFDLLLPGTDPLYRVNFEVVVNVV